MGDESGVDFALRDMISRGGEFLGPRLVIAGESITTTGGATLMTVPGLNAMAL